MILKVVDSYIMKIEKNILRIALKNSAVITLLLLLVLGLFGDMIPEHNFAISLGYAVISFLSALPAYYLSVKYRWSGGSFFSPAKLYTPLLMLVISLPISILYTSVAYGHSIREFFFESDGLYRFNMVIQVCKFATVTTVAVCILQFLGASTERDIIVNTSLARLPKESEKISDNMPADRVVRLQGGTKNSTIDLDLNRFLYAESDANYLKICLYGEQIETISLRMTVKMFEEATNAYPEIVRCHRAFVVNIRNVSYFEGSSDKGTLHFAVVKDVVPVSKTYAESITSALKKG